MLQLAKNIRLIRQVMNLTQPKFGKLFGATKGMIISYEKAIASPNELFVKRLSLLSGVPHADLLDTDLTEENIKIDMVKKDENVKRGTFTQTKEDDIVIEKPLTRTEVSDLIRTNRMQAEAILNLSRNVSSGKPGKASPPGNRGGKGNPDGTAVVPLSDKRKRP